MITNLQARNAIFAVIHLINWDKYTKDNVRNNSPSKFILAIAIILDCKRIYEVGCGIGNNLQDFKNGYVCAGTDSNRLAIEIAREKYLWHKFEQEESTSLSAFATYRWDMVFTRGLMIHLKDFQVLQTMHELYKVTKQFGYIIHLEYYSKKETKEGFRGTFLTRRNMAKRWGKYKNVKIICDVDIPHIIDDDDTRLTIIQKINNTKSLDFEEECKIYKKMYKVYNSGH